MTSSSLPPSSGDETPIDAEFEPAPAKSTAKDRERAGPGWVAFGVLTMIAMSGFVLATASAGFVPGFHPGSGKTQALQEHVENLQTAQGAASSRTGTIGSAVNTLKTRTDSLQADRTRIVTDLRDVRTELETLQADISSLQRARVASLAAPEDGSEPSAPSLDTTAIDARITALESGLLSQLDTYNIAIESLKVRLETLEEQAGSESLTAANSNNNRTEAALALSAIEAAARRGRPFLSAQQKLTSAMPGNDAVTRLAPIASKAIPTIADLRATFPALMDQALDQEATTGNGASGWMRNLFGDGVQVRRKNAVTARDHFNRALAALQVNELPEAIEHIRAVDADLQPVFTDWLNNAEDRHMLEETLEALRLAMIAEERP